MPIPGGRGAYAFEPRHHIGPLEVEEVMNRIVLNKIAPMDYDGPFKNTKAVPGDAGHAS
jgi:hypothetical protein